MCAMSAAFAVAVVAALEAQPPDAFLESRDHPAIAYSAGPVDNPIATLNRQIADHTVRLTRDGPSGYLRSVLTALNVSIDSQVAVFTPTAFEGDRVKPTNPRTIFFNDDVAVAWVRGASMLEAAAHDRRQGVVFYTLDLAPSATPQFVRDDDDCLMCHVSWDTLGVPGMVVLSTFPQTDPNQYANGFVSDDHSPFVTRWGGWYLTGTPPGRVTLGNIVKGRNLGVLTSLQGRFDTSGLLSTDSDVVALMVLEHQTHLINLMTRLGWEARVAGDADTPRVRDAAAELADDMLLVDETPFERPARGSSGFAARFSAEGPRDGQGRSLRQLDLKTRLFKYSCSYLIYSAAFDALPDHARDLVYRRLWQVLSGADHAAKYAALSAADRQATLEVLRATKTGLPAYFHPQGNGQKGQGT
jgi:hypothetical protein